MKLPQLCHNPEPQHVEQTGRAGIGGLCRQQAQAANTGEQEAQVLYTLVQGYLLLTLILVHTVNIPIWTRKGLAILWTSLVWERLCHSHGSEALYPCQTIQVHSGLHCFFAHSLGTLVFLHSLKSSLAPSRIFSQLSEATGTLYIILYHSKLFFLGSICFSNSPRCSHKDPGDYIRLCYPEPSAHLSSPPTASASLYYWAWEVNTFTDCKDCGDNVLLTQYASSKIVLS